MKTKKALDGISMGNPNDDSNIISNLDRDVKYVVDAGEMHLVFAETGESRTIDLNTHRIVIHSRASVEAYKEKMENRDNRHFTFARMEAAKELANSLTHGQLAHFTYVSTFAGYGDNIIRNPNKTPMTTKDLMKELPIPKRTFYDFLNVCLDKGIISKDDDERYVINSKYHFKGKCKGDERVVKMFSTEIRSAYKQMKPADFGLIYLLMPYIHYATNTLCRNPYEKDVAKLQKLNRKQLCELIGVDASTFSNRILKTKIDGKPVLAEIKVLSKRSYLVNPWVLYRLDSKPNDSLIGQTVDPAEPDKTLRSIFEV